MQQLFRAVDKDRSGSIEKKELDAALARLGLGLSKAQLQDLWSGLDAFRFPVRIAPQGGQMHPIP